jgi:hypothetical protein
MAEVAKDAAAAPSSGLSAKQQKLFELRMRMVFLFLVIEGKHPLFEFIHRKFILRLLSFRTRAEN